MATRKKRTSDVRRDSFDFRDLVYRPSLIELPEEQLPRWEFLDILDQGSQGACTGFGLAAVVNYLVAHKRKAPHAGSETRASARMLFEMAKRYDQWPGERYDYSSSRGAMKGWFRHGVCAEDDWPNRPAPGEADHLTEPRQKAALKQPLGAYYRVLPRRSDVHAALAEVNVLYATAATHAGWDAAKAEIPYDPRQPAAEGHAFAIVGYTAAGFLVQNSWGATWGGYVDPQGRAHPGVALWRYADFDRNVWDLWAARTALPVESLAALQGERYTLGTSGTRVQESGPPTHEIWGHYVHIDDGQYDPQGKYPTVPAEVGDITQRLVAGHSGGQAPNHIVLFAHGGLNSVEGAATRVGKWARVFEGNSIAECHFIWETGFFAELKDILLGKDKFARERVAGSSDWWDKWIEKLSQPLGYPLWFEMRSDADEAFFGKGAPAGTDFIGQLIGRLKKGGAAAPKVSLVCHSAGSIWMAQLLRQWKALNGPQIRHLVLMAPACTEQLFLECVAPALSGAAGGRLVLGASHFQLDDAREQADNVAAIYRKSLLYLVSRSFQDKNSVVPILGMEIYRDQIRKAMKAAGVADTTMAWYDPVSTPERTGATSHGGFDNDLETMNSVLQCILGAAPARPFTEDDLSGY
jgi:hypothetical protein